MARYELFDAEWDLMLTEYMWYANEQMDRQERMEIMSNTLDGIGALLRAVEPLAKNLKMPYTGFWRSLGTAVDSMPLFRYHRMDDGQGIESKPVDSTGGSHEVPTMRPRI